MSSSSYRLKAVRFSAFALVYLLVAGPISAAEDRRCEAIFAAEDLGRAPLLKTLKSNKFIIKRGFFDYQDQFKVLLGVLQRAGERAKPGALVHWLDIGAGNAKAQRDFLTDILVPGVMRFFATSVGFTAPQDEFYGHDVREIRAKHRGEVFKYLSGRMFEDVPVGEIPMADVITDFYGGMSYTNKLDVTLRRALELLKPEGIFMFLTYENGGRLTIDGKDSPLRNYLSRVRGVELVETHSAEKDATVFVLRRIPGIELLIPELMSTYYREGTPPARRFISR